jgi:hypothetical protein
MVAGGEGLGVAMNIVGASCVTTVSGTDRIVDVAAGVADGLPNWLGTISGSAVGRTDGVDAATQPVTNATSTIAASRDEFEMMIVGLQLGGMGNTRFPP